jgi:hypothetical protein
MAIGYNDGGDVLSSIGGFLEGVLTKPVGEQSTIERIGTWGIGQALPASGIGPAQTGAPRTSAGAATPSGIQASGAAWKAGGIVLLIVAGTVGAALLLSMIKR